MNIGRGEKFLLLVSIFLRVEVKGVDATLNTFCKYVLIAKGNDAVLRIFVVSLFVRRKFEATTVRTKQAVEP